MMTIVLMIPTVMLLMTRQFQALLIIRKTITTVTVIAINHKRLHAPGRIFLHALVSKVEARRALEALLYESKLD